MKIVLQKELQGKILDIGGGGEGIIGRLYGPQVIAIDYRQDELDEAPASCEKRLMDATALDFADNTFDALTAAFGIRNFQNLDACLKEMCRVLKKGGQLSILELSRPVKFPMKQLFWIYSHSILPLYGRLISKDSEAYKYLISTIESFPQGEEMVGIFKKAGFTEAKFTRLTFGICTCYFAIK